MHFKTTGIIFLTLCVLISAQQKIPPPSEVDEGYRIVFSQFYLDFDRDSQSDVLIVWEKSGHHVLQIRSVMKDTDLLVHDLGYIDFQPLLLDHHAVASQYYLLVGNTMLKYSATLNKKKLNP